MNRSVILIAMWYLAAAPAAWAEVYRCTVDGKTIYTDKPCQPGAAPTTLPPITSIDRQPTSTPMTRQFDVDARREAASNHNANSARLDAYAAQKAHDDAVRSATIAHRVIMGMTVSEVRQSIGEPTRIDFEGTPNERWIYQNGRDCHTLSFANGMLKSDRASISRRY
jgi:hypothetical protein